MVFWGLDDDDDQIYDLDTSRDPEEIAYEYTRETQSPSIVKGSESRG